MKKTHWKKLHNPDYIGAYSLMESETPIDLVVKIKSVEVRKVKGPDGKEEQCTVAELEGQKPLILNSTNCKTLTKLFNSPFIEDWSGNPVTLYVARVKAFGEVVDALRIRDALPASTLPELNEQHPKWKGALEAIKKGNTTLEAIKKVYTITPENEKKLTA